MKNQYYSPWSVLIAPVLVGLVWSPTSSANDFLVAENGGNAITRLTDLNGDGDALDLGERTLWADAVSAPRSLSFLNDTVFVVGGSPEVIRLIDLNLDGDALDTGEWSVFADGFSSPAQVLALENGCTYVSDLSLGEVWQLVDSNGDGDALDVGERSLFASGLSGVDDLIAFQDDLLVSTNVSNLVYRLADLNGDGDALDVGENLPLVDIDDGTVGGERGLLDDKLGGVFVTSSQSRSVGHARDLNGDRDMLDVAEFVPYADSVFGTLDAPGALTGLDGAMLVTDATLGQVMTIRDLNGDSDALDVGEVSPFADGLLSPADIAEMIPTGLLPLPGDFDLDGDVDGDDFLFWQRNPNVGSLSDWETNYGLPVPPISVVPEPSSLALLTITILLLSRRAARRSKSRDSCLSYLLI
jgi:hypothetical protein